MRIVPERQPEMPEIVDAVDSLGLAPQNGFIHHLFVGAVADMREDGVEMVRAQDLAARKAGADRICKVAKPFGLFRVGLVMDAEDARPLCLDQRLGGGDIRRDHVILDQALGFRLRALDDGGRSAVVIKHHAPFLQVQGKRLARRTGPAKRVPCAKQVGQDGFIQFQLSGSHAAFMPGLNLVIGQPRGRADQRTLEAVRSDIAVLVHGDDGDHGGARLVRAQRTQVVRQRFGKHRHDAVGQIDRVAAFPRLGIEG